MKNLPPDTKPCPFCGSDKLRGFGSCDGRAHIYFVVCNECGGRMRAPNKEMATAAWNTRPAEAAVPIPIGDTRPPEKP